MSDSKSSTANVADDGAIEQCLRRIVRDTSKKGEDVTVNATRAKAEAELGFDAGFLKAPEWKERSKDIIVAAVDEPDSPEKVKKSVPKPSAKAKAGTKRKSDEAQPKKKRQKKAATPSSDDENALDDSEADAPKPKTKQARGKAKKAISDDEESEVEAPKPQKPSKRSKKTLSDEYSAEDKIETAEGACDDSSALSEPPEDEKPAKTNGASPEEDEDEFSDVIDEPMPKKKRQKKSTSEASSKARTAKKPTKEKKAAKELSPDEEEIKRLQGWLVKCGIRKVWGVELKKCETNKDKIKHLKKMLEDVGMTGRYSQEKATKIKEARELAAELESAKEFNEQWGGGGEEESEEEGARPRRGLKPRGLIDFGDSGDEGSD